MDVDRQRRGQQKLRRKQLVEQCQHQRVFDDLRNRWRLREQRIYPFAAQALEVVATELAAVQPGRERGFDVVHRACVQQVFDDHAAVALDGGKRGGVSECSGVEMLHGCGLCVGVHPSMARGNNECSHS